MLRGFVTVRRAKAVGAGVAAADDDDVFAGGEDLIRNAIAFADLVRLRQEIHGEVDALEFAARDLEIARLFGAAGQQNGVEIAAQIFDRDVLADMRVGDELHAFGRASVQPPVDEMLLHLEIGDAVAEQSADAVGFLEDRDRSDRRAPVAARRRDPPGPEPTTATRLPVRLRGGSGTIQPSSKARSTMVFSMCLMVTGGSLMPSTQAASQGAGQMRPVNSGKLLVECRTRMASLQRSLKTRSFQSGMMLLTGQPVWQKGTPQSMQRAPCVRTFSSGKWLVDLEPVVDAFGAGRRCGSSREYSRNPVGLPMVRTSALALRVAITGAIDVS